MGTEIVFVLIWPLLLICIPAGIWFWFPVAKWESSPGLTHLRGYLPLLAGFVISVTGLMLFSYMESSAEFTSLVQQGHYTEAQRVLYLPARAIGGAIILSVFVLPFICLVVIPCTAKLVMAEQLTWAAIGFRVVVAWLGVSSLGWIFSPEISPPSFADILKSTSVPMAISIFPIPVAALLTRRK